MIGINSNLLTNDYGVAQVSTFVPFLSYINDLPFSVNCKPRFFSDNTYLVYYSPIPQY